jgi:rubrerythrin
MTHHTTTPTVSERLRRRYLSRLIAHPKGRAHLLTALADAEASGESAVFDRLLSKVDDPQLQKMIRRHADDEIRHAEMFRACAARAGVEADPIPAKLRVIDRLDVATGHLLDRGVRGPSDVMEAYLLLQVIEERAISQFGLFEEMFRPVDPETADVLAQVARDEERHLKYCHAIARRYAPDAATHAETLQRFRDIEARSFSENSRENMRWLIARGYVAIGSAERLFWLGMAELNEWTGHEERTPFWDQPPARAIDHATLAAAA